MLASKVRVAREGIAHYELRVGSENETQEYLIPRPRAWIGGWELDERIVVQYYFCYFILINRTKCEERFCDCIGAVCG